MSAPRSRRGTGPLRLWPGLLVVAVALLALVESALVSSLNPDVAVPVTAFALLGLANVVVGALAMTRRPGNRTGALLCVGGISMLAAAAANLGAPVLLLVGLLAAELPIAVLLHLVLAFPTGRPSSQAARVLVVVGYIVTLGLTIPQYLFDPAAIDLLRIAARPDVQSDLNWVQDRLGAAVVLAATVVMVRQILATDARRNRRSVLLGVYGYGVGVLLFLPFSANVIAPAAGWSPLTLFTVQVVALAPTPVVFAAGILFGGFGRSGAVSELGDRLGAFDVGPGAIRDVLASALGDPAIELLRALPDGGLLRSDGEPGELPPAGDRRTVRVIEGPDGPLAMLVFDADRIDDPEAVATAGNIVALALQRDRLTSQLLRSNEALRESRIRIIEHGDLQRRALARDLHDIVQSRLLLASVRAGQLLAYEKLEPDTQRAAMALFAELSGALTEMRRLVHGVMPALLVERGLVAAVEDLLDRLPVSARLVAPDPIDVSDVLASTAYVVIVEATSNAVKHAQAKEITVRVEFADGALEVEVSDDGIGGADPLGWGLSSSADRVDALGGRLSIVSPAGRGTSVHATIPTGV